MNTTSSAVPIDVKPVCDEWFPLADPIRYAMTAEPSDDEDEWMCYSIFRPECEGRCLVDSGAEMGMAGSEWLQDLFDKLSKLGLQPKSEEKYQKFSGIAGFKCESHRRWHVPVGIYGKHT